MLTAGIDSLNISKKSILFALSRYKLDSGEFADGLLNRERA
jgi:hypothetical protein